MMAIADIYAQGVQGKFIIGINAAQVDGDAMFGFNRIGPVVGGAANVKITQKLSFQPELYYSMRGASSTIYQPFLSTILHYVDVPLIINYQLKKRWALQAGLSGCYLVNALIDPVGYGYIDVTNRLNKYDICFVVGAEFAISEEWAVNIRYNYSAIPFGKQSADNTALLNYSNWFNNYLNFTIRYLFIDRAKEKK